MVLAAKLKCAARYADKRRHVASWLDIPQRFKVKVVAITYAKCNFMDLLENLAHNTDTWPMSGVARCGCLYCKR